MSYPGVGHAVVLRIAGMKSAPYHDRPVVFPAAGRSTLFGVTVMYKEYLTDHTEPFLAGQNRILKRIAAGASLPDVLTSLVRLIEAQTGGMFCSILLLDEDGVHLRHGAAPSLPASYVSAIDGMLIGPKAGSCGTCAYLERPVVITDIDTDPLWDDFRDLAVAFGFRACWSSPIWSPSGRVSGTFAMYYLAPRGPSPEEEHVIEVGTHIASIAIESHRAAESLRRSEERSQAILRAIPDSMFLLDSALTYLDSQSRESCGRVIPTAELIGRKMDDVLPPALAERFARSFQKARESGEVQLVEYNFPLNEQTKYNEARIVPISDGRFLALVRDITERKLAEETLRKTETELRNSNAEIRELAGRLMNAQEEERRRISRELHDDLNQKVASLSIRISIIKNKFGTNGLLRNQLDGLQNLSVDIANGIRRLSHELHPAMLEHLGLTSALKAYVDEFSRLEKIKVGLVVPDETEAIPQDIAVCLYRIAQESLRNIVKHAGVNQAQIKLTLDDRTIRLDVTDSGRGFDLASARSNGGLGLKSMEERVRLVQGSFGISTERGCGSRLEVAIPYRKAI
jgi:PAS domain S-box-containing protein